MIGLFLVSLLLTWQFVGYPLLMGLVALRAKPKAKDESHTPFVSIIVPAYNEQQVIEQRIKNLDGLDYPTDRYEIIVVESGSTDATTEIVDALIASRETDQPGLKLVKELERRGKASAINVGKRHARGEIILVTDANASFNRAALREIMPHFADPCVGAVGGRYAVANSDQGLASEESFYWELEYIMRRGESALDSACLFHGEINAWRKHLGETDTGIISEDLDLAIQIRRQGYKVAYEPKAIAYEVTGTTAKEQIIRRKKVATGTILCFRKHLNYFLLPRDLYSALLFPSHKGLAVLSPFLLLAIILSYLISWNVKVIAIHLASTGLISVMLFGALIWIKSKLMENQSGKQYQARLSIACMARLVWYVLINEYLLVLAWKDFFLGEYSVLWERAESTRAELLDLAS